MNLKEVLETCPKAAEKYYQWAGNALKKLQEKWADEIPPDVERELPEIDQAIIKHYAQNALISELRNLYDFFDTEGIKMWPLFIIQDPENFSEGYWGFEIRTDHEISDENEEYKTRMEAEQAGFVRSFQYLEKKLNNGTEKDS